MMQKTRAAGRRLVAALGAAEADRLAGHDAGHRVAGVHRVGVHHPGHDLGVRVDVGGGDVALRTDQDLDLGREAAGQRLDLLQGQLLGIDDDAALAAAEGNADDRALPGHPHREGLDLVERHVLVVADAALRGTAPEVVLDAVAREDLDRAVVHLHREVDGQLPSRLTQHPPQARVEVEPVGGQIELLLGDLPRVDRRGDMLGGHGTGGPPCRARSPVANAHVMGRLPGGPIGARRSTGIAGGRAARHRTPPEYSRGPGRALSSGPRSTIAPRQPGPRCGPTDAPDGLDRDVVRRDPLALATTSSRNVSKSAGGV